MISSHRLKSAISSPSEAVASILKTLKPNRATRVKVINANDCVLATNVKSPMHAPPFDNSAMDGYGFRFDDLKSHVTLQVVGVSEAGKPFVGVLKKGQAIRIYTGAKLPKGVDTVVMQEKVIVNGDAISFQDAAMQKGTNIRRTGSEIRKGEIALQKGTLLSPAACAFLTSLGIKAIEIHPKPSVCIITTGNELVSTGKKLKAGQIFESNATALLLALKQEGVNHVKTQKVKDDALAMDRAFKKAASKFDVVIFTGGISVGDLDFTETTFQKNGVQKVFYKLKQKPGKPIYFGTSKGKAVFGLPGNPASVMTCFYLYVIPALRTLQNHPEKELPRIKLPSMNDLQRKPGMTAFLKAHTNLRGVQLLDGQESYIMRSFAKANALVVLDPEVEHVKKNQLVETILLP